MATRKPNSTQAENEAWLIRNCPFSFTLSLLGRRWRAALLWKLGEEPLHFAELARRLPRASEKMLAQELQGLVEVGLVERCADGERVRYALTSKGHALEPTLTAMHTFGERHRDGGEGAPRADS